MIRCGWCGHATANPDRCTTCGHEDPARPWIQRGSAVPVIEGRTDSEDIRKRLATARAELTALGERATAERLAELLDVSPRTVRRWQTNAIAGPRTHTPRGVR